MTTDVFEVVLGATGDRATADCPEAILLAAATLVDDEIAFGTHRGRGALRVLRATLFVTENDAYERVLTAFARGGRRAP